MKLKLLYLALLTASFAQGQSIVQNGGFEQFTGLTPNSWTINSGETEPGFTVSEGSKSLLGYLTSPNSFTTPYLSLSQSFTLTDTQKYTLKFDYFIPGSSISNYISRIGYELALNNSSDAFFFPPMTSPAVAYGVWKTTTIEFNILAFRSPATSASIKLTLSANTEMGFDYNAIYFDNVSIVQSTTLGTQTFDKKSNPIVAVTQSELRLHSDFATSSYVVYAMNGQAVKRGSNNSSDSIDISGLAKGVYLLKLNNLESSVKFVK